MGIDARVYVKTREAVTDEQLNDWGYRLGEAFEPSKFWLPKIGESYSWREGNGAISRASDIPSDHGDELPKDGETFLAVHVMTRYYGEGYERGDILFLVMLGEWLERNIPGAEVLYGGDCDDRLAPFDKARREELVAHWASKGFPYYSSFGRIVAGSSSHPWGPGWPHCKRYRKPMIQNGSGGKYASFYCPGTGEACTWRDGKWVDTDTFENKKLDTEPLLI